jgi:endonuclease-8
MPEGPEIRRMVDDIGKAIVGRTARQVFFAFDHLKPFEAELAGRQVTCVEARGKAVLVHFEATAEDGPWCVYSHNQLYGKWRTGAADREPSTNRQLRFAVFALRKAARLFSASDIFVVRPDALDQVGYLSRLGPDPLNQAVDIGDLMAIFDDKRFAGRALGGLLLDQGFMAGIGNYLRSEILFEARIAPSTRPGDLAPADRERLAQAILEMLSRAYRLKGVTNDPERAERLKQAGWTFGQRRHMVFDRDGQACHDCDTPISKVQIASRRLYFCPMCQGVRARSSDGPAPDLR